jgi:hypothetical protein
LGEAQAKKAVKTKGMATTVLINFILWFITFIPFWQSTKNDPDKNLTKIQERGKGNYFGQGHHKTRPMMGRRKSPGSSVGKCIICDGKRIRPLR